MDYILCL